MNACELRPGHERDEHMHGHCSAMARYSTRAPEAFTTCAHLVVSDSM